MAESAAKLTKARILAIAQLIVGFLLICFGIGERDVEELVTHNICGGILAGIWVSRIRTWQTVKYSVLRVKKS